MKSWNNTRSGLLVLSVALLSTQGASAALTLWIDSNSKEYYFTGSDSLTPDAMNTFQWSSGIQNTSAGFLVPNELMPGSAFSGSIAFSLFDEGGFTFTLPFANPVSETISGDGTRNSYDPTVNTFNSLLSANGMVVLENLASSNTVVPVALGSGESLTIAAVPEVSTSISFLGGLSLLLLRSRRRSA